MAHRTVQLVILLIALQDAGVQAGEILATGKVVRVVPISAAPRVAPGGDCESPRPVDGTDLAALLAWDLQVGCAGSGERPVQGYRVYYEWDHRIYDTVMARMPADTIPLRISVQ